MVGLCALYYISLPCFQNSFCSLSFLGLYTCSTLFLKYFSPKSLLYISSSPKKILKKMHLSLSLRLDITSSGKRSLSAPQSRSGLGDLPLGPSAPRAPARALTVAPCSCVYSAHQPMSPGNRGHNCCSHEILSSCSGPSLYKGSLTGAKYCSLWEQIFLKLIFSLFPPNSWTLENGLTS